MPELAILCACILLAGFFAGSETGAYCLNRLRLRLRAEQGLASARLLLRFVRKPRLAISTTLVGTNVGHYLATVLFTHHLAMVVTAGRAELLSGLIMPPILLVFAEIIPKSLFQHHADVVMYRAVWPLRLSQVVLYPVAAALRWLGGLPLKWLGKDTGPVTPRFTSEAFRFYLSEGTERGVISESQRRMAENIMHLRSLAVRGTMTPLDNAVMVADDASDEDVMAAFRSHRYSRILVFQGKRERVSGAINVIDLASLGAGQNGAPAAIALARGVLTFDPDMSVADALWTLRQARQQIGIVTDEDGKALGLVTVKDLVEEIVGELAAW
jgi:CBS domain containing-hemolysin-like protein